MIWLLSEENKSVYDIVHFLETDQGNQKKMYGIQALSLSGQPCNWAEMDSSPNIDEIPGAKQGTPARKLMDYKWYVVLITCRNH